MKIFIIIAFTVLGTAHADTLSNVLMGIQPKVKISYVQSDNIIYQTQSGTDIPNYMKPALIWIGNKLYPILSGSSDGKGKPQIIGIGSQIKHISRKLTPSGIPVRNKNWPMYVLSNKFIYRVRSGTTRPDFTQPEYAVNGNTLYLADHSSRNPMPKGVRFHLVY